MLIRWLGGDFVSKRIRIIIPAAALILLALCAGLFYFHRRDPDQNPLLPAHPKTGIFYRVEPEGTCSADGTPWHGDLKLGTENKVIVYFFGGGIALDDYTTAHSYSVARYDGFYFDTEDWILDYLAESGIGADREDNPFRDWTIIGIPYTTGDMHIGSGEYVSTSVDGTKKTARFHGYDNYTAMMQAAVPYIGTPEDLLILGTSAGGFGAALLAEDVMGYFPGTENVTVCVDSSFLVMDDWPSVARELWQAPDAVSRVLTGDNILLDPLVALYQHYGDKVKILYDCSVRDGELSRFQSYIDTGTGRTDNAAGDGLQEKMAVMAEQIRQQIPTAGLFFWDGLPFSEEEGNTLTRHTILVSGYAYEPLTDGVSVLEWVHAAVEGKVTSHGLELLTKQY